ncbi:MAG: hypothetical protein H6868_07755 [Rhodospirillales bacterium]|nr:hypothetical protein [Rhodospirillales bacterium]
MGTQQIRQVNRPEDLDDETAYAMTETVLSDYLALHKRVLHKLRHARQATLTTLEEINHFFELVKLDEAIEQYSDMWDRDIKKFVGSGLTEEELRHIEGALDSVPLAVKVHYQMLLDKDPLPEMEVDLQERDRAYKIISQIYQQELM